MKKQFLLIITLMTTLALSAADLTGKRIYINPGHGSFGPNDRPMATIPYPALSTTGMPDTCGFYETNTNLWKCLELGKKLAEAGATVDYSRTANGPWPYVYPYADYTYAGYQALSDYTKYNRNLSEICEEVESGNYDFFISVHSNAATDGTATNYPIILYRGTDAGDNMAGDSRQRATSIWPYLYECMASGLDPASAYGLTNPNVRGDISFYGSSSTRKDPVTGQSYTGYLGVLKHGVPGFLSEGYFHTYQPARHRALNRDYCRQEGVRYFRGIMSYYGADAESTGYIMGTVKDLHEKIVNKLFSYTPKTNDQWLPCNGAEVVLYKGGKEIGRYQVDTLYNGLFVFDNLEPGNDYTLDATCKDYKPLFDEYKTPITVEANKTTYPMIFLESESYEPPKEVFVTYPDPAQGAWLGLAGTYETAEIYTAQTLESLSSLTIRRSIIRDANTMYVLAINEQKEPYLYLVNPTTHAIVEQLPTDFCTVSAKGNLKLSDIAVTAEGILIGCNEESTSFNPANKWQVYKWTKSTEGWTGEVWMDNTNNETAGNYNNAMTGTTLAYAGTLEDGTLYTTAYTTGSDARGVRFIMYSVVDGVFAGAMRNQNAAYTLAAMGENIRFVVSPRGDNRIIVTDTNIAPFEWESVAKTAGEPIVLGELTDLKGVAGIGCFKYAKHDVLTAPLLNAEGAVTGVGLYDMTNGLSQAKVIGLSTSSLAVPAAAAYSYAAGVVADKDITLWLQTDDMLNSFSTIGKEQVAIANVYAYDLKMEKDDAAYHFTFRTNAPVLSAEIVFYEEDEEVGFVPASVSDLQGSATVTFNELPLTPAAKATWAVRVHGQSVGDWARIHSQKVADLGITRGFCSVDNSPESDYFGRIYILDRAGANSANSGLHAFNQDYTRINTTVLRGGRAMYGSPYRSFVDDQGYIWLSDGSDPYSGIVVANPADLEGNYEEFFQFTNRNSAGVLSNNGIELGASCLGLSVYGTGVDAKLIAYNEDGGSLLPTLGLAIYNIGTEDGTYLHAWDVAPSATMQLTGQAAYDGYPLGCSHGIWVATRRTAGNNNNSATALKFYSWEGKELLSSASDEYKEIIDGCASGAYALTPDESSLVMIDGSKNLLCFDIVWEGDKPVLTLRYAYACGISDIREMHFDYAGNLVTSGTETFTVFTIPTDDNTTTTPAKKSLVVIAPDNGSGTGINQEIAADDMSGVWYSNGTLYNSNGLMLQVYNVNGQLIATGNSDLCLDAVPQGVYIVRANAGTLKFVK
ncbi:MAG: N-acetylmuramoyl-L-alanine amidase [Paludibacter sp.]|nr:N-acetylmuramoyl-L-alanine amidase [Bacteroidales bacterium]MCM1068614.1 N-acetylmuramoyl-L-alanine amidase [Prevotella sp.]MCM1353278.1 N-acetylmuramoyl-L-alanine amidase [Bacteroides sp.]MCM1442314.1 N-acetylmuramoyl-L-alanine amidase [Muribaculum sp.]MCM1481133.1 N-acetylmuramoyl-L-alanine amidase [Paludibacter sp.]